jgi:hypothetical protein
MIDQQTATKKAIEEIAKLDFHHLLLLQRNLSEHIHNCFEHAAVLNIKNQQSPRH